jgi:hypothetical protein
MGSSLGSGFSFLVVSRSPKQAKRPALLSSKRSKAGRFAYLEERIPTAARPYPRPLAYAEERPSAPQHPKSNTNQNKRYDDPAVPF